MAFCVKCGVEGEGSFCANCGTARAPIVAMPQDTVSIYGAVGQPAPQLQVDTSIRHGVPALISAIFPGVGQLIKGDISGGILVWVGGLVLAILFVAWTPVGIQIIPMIGWLVIWVWQIYNAYVGPDGPTKQALKKKGR